MAAKQGYASIGIDVKVGTTALNFVTNIGDIGGTPNMLDSTCMKDKMKHNVAGVQSADAFEITYLYDNSDTTSDYRVLRALESAGNSVAVEVTFPDGTKFTSSGTVSNRITGVGVDSLISAVCSIALDADWTVANPSA